MACLNELRCASSGATMIVELLEGSILDKEIKISLKLNISVPWNLALDHCAVCERSTTVIASAEKELNIVFS